MSERVDAERGARMRQIREARAEDQAQFAASLDAAAKSLGLAARYTLFDVSRRETARKKLDPDDFATVAMLDPERRGWTWVAFGKAITIGKDAYELLAGQRVATGRKTG